MKLKQKILAFLLAFSMVWSVFEPGVLGTIQVNAATEGVTITTNLKDGSEVRITKKTFSVNARNEKNEKIPVTAEFEGKELSPTWDDQVTTSFTLNFADKEDGEYTVVLTAGDTEKTFHITYKKAKQGECVGYAIMDVEAFTISKGFIVKPTLVPVIEGETTADALCKMIRKEGYDVDYSGSPSSGFYLQGIYGSNYSRNKTATKPLDLSGAELESGIANQIPSLEDYFDADDYQEGWLGEFTCGFMTGWMYCANGKFLNVGMADYYLEPGDVIRAQFTVYYGGDIGGAEGWGDMLPGAISVANKDDLYRAMVNVESACDDKKIEVTDKVTGALDQAYRVAKDITVDQAKINQATSALERLLEVEETPQPTATEEPQISYKQFEADWPDFRNGEDNTGITNAKTPTEANKTDLLWATKVGAGFGGNSAGSPILVDGYLYCMQGKNLLKIDTKTGQPVVDENGEQVKGTMVGMSSYNIMPPTYANGMIFVGLAGGTVQAFNAETLESLWVYKDELGGQPNSPIVYADGKVYTGFWNSEVKDAHFACISVKDEDTTNQTEEKSALWTDTVVGGFYWAGALAKGDYIYVGTEDGTSSANSPTAKLLCYDKKTGEVKDSINEMVGDIRSSLSYNKETDRVFFTTKGGMLYSVKLKKDGGFAKETLTSVSLLGASTSTPCVYNGRIYVGVSGSSQFGTSGHKVKVYSIEKNGEMTFAYEAEMPGYPQASGTLTTAYEKEDDSAYIYFTYNSNPGGIYVLKDKPGQESPKLLYL